MIRVAPSSKEARLIWNLAKTGKYRLDRLRLMSYDTLVALWLEYTCQRYAGVSYSQS